MKKWILFFVLLLLSLYVYGQEYPDSLIIWAFSTAPVMDAVEDAVYVCSEIPIAIPDSADDPAELRGPEDLSGYFKIGVYCNSLYIFIDVNDDILDNDDAGAPYNNDGVEIFFDGDNSKLYRSADGVNDIQMRIERDKDLGHHIQDAGGMGVDAPWYDSTWTYYVQKEKDGGIGYTVECRFYINGFNLNKDKWDDWFGFDVQINDADGANRTNMLRWHAHTNDTWHWAHLLGNAKYYSGSYTCPPDIVIFADTLDFGMVALGTTKSLELFMANWGDLDLDVNHIIPGNDDYAVIPDYATIGGGGSEQLNVSFTPTLIGKIATKLTFKSNDPDDSVSYIILRGTGTEPSEMEAPFAANIPATCQLFQNYPNPFNPLTRLLYALPEASHVEIVLYNIAGQSVAILVNGNKSAGFHHIDFNAAAFASGVYIYKMKAGNLTRVRKMVILK
jgi:hypothetical protein